MAVPFARAGCHLILLARRETQLLETRQACIAEGVGGEELILKLDLTDPAAIGAVLTGAAGIGALG